jgi:hypothetical protein
MQKALHELRPLIHSLWVAAAIYQGPKSISHRQHWTNTTTPLKAAAAV